MSKPGKRTPVAKRLSFDMRMVERERARARAAESRHREQAFAAERLLFQRWRRECKRFGMEVPRDPFLLDVLASITVENPGEKWRWSGGTNNHGVPSVRIESRSERSVVRVLAEAFGIVTPEQNGILYPTTDRDDVNPFHRTLRIGSNKPIGARTWNPKAKAS